MKSIYGHWMLSIRYSTSICMAMPSNGLYTEVSIGMALHQGVGKFLPTTKCYYNSIYWTETIKTLTRNYKIVNSSLYNMGWVLGLVIFFTFF